MHTDLLWKQCSQEMVHFQQFSYPFITAESFPLNINFFQLCADLKQSFLWKWSEKYHIIMVDTDCLVLYPIKPTRVPNTCYLVHHLSTLYMLAVSMCAGDLAYHDDVIKWKHFPCYCPFVRSPVNSQHKGQWCGALMFSLICAWIKGCVNNCEAGDLRCNCTHYDVTVM